MQNPFDQFDLPQQGTVNPFDQLPEQGGLPPIQTPTPPDLASVPTWGANNPNAWALYRTVVPTLDSINAHRKPLLQYSGMMAGNILGGGPLSPGGIAGAGLGFAAGDMVNNYFDENTGVRPAPDMLGRIQQTGMGFTEGSLTQMGAEGGTALLDKGLKALKNITVEGRKLPEWLYSKALSTPLTERWKATIPTKDWTKREMVVQQGLADEILPTVEGKQQVVNRIRDLEQEVSEVVGALPQKGAMPSGKPVEMTVDDIKAALDPLKAKASLSRDSQEGLAATQKIEDNYTAFANRNWTGKMSPSEVQQMKMQLHSDATFDLSKPVLKGDNRFTEEATKALAEKAMLHLEGLAPELQFLNKKTSYYIDLQKAIEHTIAKSDASQAATLGAYILATGRHWGVAILDTVLKTPSVRASLAFALQKAGVVWKVATPAVAGAAVAGENYNQKPNYGQTPYQY